jgi:hypothetical protein
MSVVRATSATFRSSLGAGALAAVLGLHAAGAAAAPPDILGIRAGMPPGEAYQAVQAFDPTHRVLVSQVAIPQLLGAKAAAFQFGPENVDSSKDLLTVNLTLPPNAQQVWQVRRVITGINSTRERLIASLLEKYGANPASQLMGNYVWVFSEQGQSVTLSPQDFKACQHLAVPVTVIDLPMLGPTRNEVIAAGAPVLQSVPPLLDPAKSPQCQALVWVNAAIIGEPPNLSLTVQISDFTLQNRTSFALMSFFNGLAAKEQQKATETAEHSALPKL